MKWKISTRQLLYLAWFVSLLAVTGSLYFSEIRHLPPCALCWYQRIFMYPLAVILPLGLLRRDPNVARYVGALSGIGFLIAFYHNLLYYGLLPERLAACTVGLSCTVRQIEWFGFISIPLLSLIAFTAIIAAMVLVNRASAQELK